MAGCCGKCCSSWTVPTLLWSFLSVASAALCSLGLYFSNWLQHEVDGSFNSLSSYRLCVNQTSEISTDCDSYFTFNEIVSPEWKAVTVLMGLGACLLVFSGLISLFACCVHRFCNKCLVCTLAVLQCLGGKCGSTCILLACSREHTKSCSVAIRLLVTSMEVPSKRVAMKVRTTPCCTRYPFSTHNSQSTLLCTSLSLEETHCSVTVDRQPKVFY